MSLTIAAIANKALTAVQGAITDAVYVATLTNTVQGAQATYNVTTGAYATAQGERTGRAVLVSMTPGRAAMFAPYVAGPSDEVYLLEGFAAVAENDLMQITDQPQRTITAVQDIGGSVYYVIAR